MNVAKGLASTGLNNYLGLTYLHDGTNWEVSQLFGTGSDLTENLDFHYFGGTDAHYSVDRMGTITGEILFTCEQGHGRMILNEGENFKAVSSSIIFGAMADGEGLNLKPYLMAELINQFLGLNADYQLSLVASPEEGGETEGSGMHKAGYPVEVNATPAVGWGFVNWTNLLGEVVSLDQTYSFIMPASTMTLIANFEPMTGQDELSSPVLVSLYPNPFTDRVFLDIDPKFIGSEFRIADMTGRNVSGGIIKSENMHLDLGNLNTGVYILTITGQPFEPIRIFKR